MRNTEMARLGGLDCRWTTTMSDAWFLEPAGTMAREDPDLHQRFIADVGTDRILGRWEASADEGVTWREDFDLAFVRA